MIIFYLINRRLTAKCKFRLFKIRLYEYYGIYVHFYQHVIGSNYKDGHKMSENEYNIPFH